MREIISTLEKQIITNPLVALGILVAILGIIVAIVIYWRTKNQKRAGFDVWLVPRINEYKKGVKPAKPFIDVYFKNYNQSDIRFHKAQFTYWDRQPQDLGFLTPITVPAFWNNSERPLHNIYGMSMSVFEGNIKSICFESNLKNRRFIWDFKLKQIKKKLLKAQKEYKKQVADYKSTKQG